MVEVVAAVASRSPKGADGNQDRVAIVRPSDDPASAGVVVCDGVGGLPASGPVADRFATLAAGHLAEYGIGAGVWELDAALAAEQDPPRTARPR